MDIVFGILIAILFLVGSVSKQKKREQAQREARARTMAPPPADPRFPSVPSMEDARIPTFSGEASPGLEGEPVEELPVRPAPAARRVYEGGSPRAEGGPAAAGSVIMPTVTVAAHMEATQGRRATLEGGANIHAHTEGSMEGHRPAARKTTSQGLAQQPYDRGTIVPDILNRLGHDPGAVAEGVILSEILGKPKALRRV